MSFQKNHHVKQRTEGLLVVGEVSVHIQSIAKVPLSKVFNPPLMLRLSCDKPRAHPDMYPPFAYMNLR